MSCTILKVDVLAFAAELSTLSDAAWAIILAFINDFDIHCDPTLRKMALCLLAAHVGTISGTTSSSGTAGPIISESAGGLKRTYANPTSTAATSDFGRTTYGQQFLAILKFSWSTKGPFLL